MTSDLILEILLFVGAAFAMFKAGGAYTIWRIQKDLIALENGELEYIDEEEMIQHDLNNEFMKIIKEDNVFYAYGNKGRFLTQGKDLNELFTNVKKYFPKTVWMIGNDNDTLSEEEQESILPILKSIFEGSSKNE